MLNLSPQKHPWITAVGRTRYKVAGGAYGDGIPPYKLIPYRTIAVDPAVIPFGTVLYVTRARGASIVLPTGETVPHDGYFFAADRGGAIKNNHIDVFTGVDHANRFSSFVHGVKTKTFEARVVDDASIQTRLDNVHR